MTTCRLSLILCCHLSGKSIPPMRFSGMKLGEEKVWSAAPDSLWELMKRKEVTVFMTRQFDGIGDFLIISRLFCSSPLMKLSSIWKAGLGKKSNCSHAFTSGELIFQSSTSPSTEAFVPQTPTRRQFDGVFPW